jgi:uncharacterized coiled-coil protein SlyX
MNPDELQQTVASLHDELAQTTNVDEATRQRLAELIPDIQRLVESSGAQTPAAETPSADRAAEPAQLMQHLRDAIEKFEARHPQLTATLQQLVDRLSEIGI